MIGVTVFSYVMLVSKTKVARMVLLSDVTLGSVPVKSGELVQMHHNSDINIILPGSILVDSK